MGRPVLLITQSTSDRLSIIVPTEGIEKIGIAVDFHLESRAGTNGRITASRQNRREPFEADIVVFYKPTPTLRPTFDFPPPCFPQSRARAVSLRKIIDDMIYFLCTGQFS
jgi:hypothetical protein